MEMEHSSTGGGDLRIVPAVKNIPAANLEKKVDSKAEICPEAAPKVKTSKKTRSAAKNQKMVSPKKRPKRSQKPVDRLNISSLKGSSYVKK